MQERHGRVLAAAESTRHDARGELARVRVEHGETGRVAEALRGALAAAAAQAERASRTGGGAELSAEACAAHGGGGGHKPPPSRLSAGATSGSRRVV